MSDNFRYITASQLAKAIDVSPAAITLASKSRKGNLPKLQTVFLDGKKKYDLESSNVKQYIKEQVAKGKTFDINRVFVDAPAINLQTPKQPNQQQLFNQSEEHEQEPEVDYAQKKNELTCIKLEEDIKQKRLQNAKLSGLLLPVEETRFVLNYAITCFTSNTMSFMNNMLGLIIRELNGTDAQYVQFNNMIKESYIENCEDSKLNINSGLDKAIEDYREVRSRGERK